MKLLMGAAALAAAMNAGAVGLSVVGGDVIAVAAVNNLITGGSYNIGGNVLLDFAANVTATYLGHEASYSNDFNFNGQTLNNKTSSVGDTIQALAVAPGLLEFGFYSRNVGAGVANGANRLFGDWQSIDGVRVNIGGGAWWLLRAEGAAPEWQKEWGSNHDARSSPLAARRDSDASGRLVPAPVWGQPDARGFRGGLRSTLRS